jgi:hypothetical protein
MGIRKSPQLSSAENSVQVTDKRPIQHAIKVRKIPRLIVPQQGTGLQLSGRDRILQLQKITAALAFRHFIPVEL